VGSLTVRRRREDDRSVLALDGELDIATVPVLREAALSELDSTETRTLVLDLAALTFLDSTGLGCWIELRNRAEESGRTLELADVPAGAERTVRIAGLAPLFGLEPA
jgi:anti-sigma B factor antagonist